jgi:hypothetical protein
MSVVIVFTERLDSVQYCLMYAFSCHTIDTCGEEQDVVGGRDGRCTHCRG